MTNNVSEINNRKCVGCKACKDICPNNAIEYKVDKEGFWYPIVDFSLCCECGKCIKVCPAVEYARQKREIKVYAAHTIDEKVREKSTSGGIFYELASYVIENGGCVVGSVYSEDWKSAKHILIDKKSDLEPLLGTKYIQSDTEDIYKLIKGLLNQGKKVLFAGTPCQNVALKKFISKDYEELIQMDFICNAVNSPLVFKEYLSELEKKENAKIIRFQSKNKRYGWKSLRNLAVFSNGHEYLPSTEDDKWEKGFLRECMYQRPSCYECLYRNIEERVSDITVGDFWGLDDIMVFDEYRGMSVLITHGKKGEEILKKIKDRLFIVRKRIDNVYGGNRRLLENPVINPNRKSFFETLSKKGFDYACDCFFSKNESRTRSNIIREILNVSKRKDVDLIGYIKLNFFCSQIESKHGERIIPYKNTKIEINKGAKILLDGFTNIDIGKGKVKKSNAETLIRLGRDSVWRINRGGIVNYGVTVELLPNSEFVTGFFEINTGSCIVANKKIQFGEDVILGRNNIIYDSDFHDIRSNRGVLVNLPKEVVIGDHVWFTTDNIVHKGVRVGNNCIIGPKCVVVKDIPDNSIYSQEQVPCTKKLSAVWSRESKNKYMEYYINYKIILVGYGKEGKKFYESYKDNIIEIIDNSGIEGTKTLADFYRKNKSIDEDTIFVIGTLKYFDELYDSVRKLYRTSRIVPLS